MKIDPIPTNINSLGLPAEGAVVYIGVANKYPRTLANQLTVKNGKDGDTISNPFFIGADGFYRNSSFTGDRVFPWIDESNYSVLWETASGGKIDYIHDVPSDAIGTGTNEGIADRCFDSFDSALNDTYADVDLMFIRSEIGGWRGTALGPDQGFYAYRTGNVGPASTGDVDLFYNSAGLEYKFTEKMDIYKNAISGLAATNKQDAIDELATTNFDPFFNIWKETDIAVTALFTSVTWHEPASLWVAVGGAGLIYTSPEGYTWTSQTSGTTKTLKGIESNGTILVAISDDGIQTLTSVDAVIWSVNTVTLGGTNHDLFYGDDLFIAIGNTGYLSTSPDGIAWTVRTSNATVNLVEGTYDDVIGKYVAVGSGELTVSSDGITWAAQATPSAMNLVGATSNGLLYVAAGSGGIVTSPDAVTWTENVFVSDPSNGPQLDCTWGGGVFLAFGTRTFSYSLDGLRWSRMNPPDDEQNAGMHYGYYNNGAFVIVGNELTGGNLMTLRSGIKANP